MGGFAAHALSYQPDSIPHMDKTLGFVVVGGTSLASPLSAALVSNAGSFNVSAKAECIDLYRWMALYSLEGLSMIETLISLPLEGDGAVTAANPNHSDKLVRAAAGAAMLSISVARSYKLAAANADCPAFVVISPGVCACWVSELVTWAIAPPRP
jgi:hypothetical protein